MTHIRFTHIKFLTLSAVMAWSLPLKAATPIEAPWKDVCNVAGGHELKITTLDGNSVSGYCMSINVDEIAVSKKGHPVTMIARATLARIQMRSRKGHRLSSLGTGVREGLRQGFEWLFSPSAPLGLVMVPGTLAWGAVAAPFCLLSDLKNSGTEEHEIKVF
jgi:hypothetical protein